MQNTIYLTLGQAAKETGRSKSVIFKALETGKLSYVEKTPAGYKIDPAELFRVFPMGGTKNAKTEQSGTDIENDYLKRENELLREQIRREKEQADYWRQQATNLLTHQNETAQNDDKSVHVEQGTPVQEQVQGPAKTESMLFKKLFGRR